MTERLKKIGEVKAVQFKKNFDQVYDFWKKKAEDEYKYFGELRFIKEHGKVFVYTILNIDLDNEEVISQDFD